MSRARFAWVMLIATWFVVTADARAAGWLPRPGIELSGSYSTVSRTSEDPSFDTFDAVYGGGWSMGATAEWMPAPTWTVVSGLRYIEAGQNQRINFTISDSVSTLFSGHVDLKDRWRWLAVPVRVRVTPWAFPLSLEAGPEVQLLLGARSNQVLQNPPQALSAGSDPSRTIRLAPTAQIFEDVGTFGDGDATNRYRRVNFVLTGGVSFAWPAQAGRLVAHARCGFGLNDLRKSDLVAGRTRTVEVGLGWQW